MSLIDTRTGIVSAAAEGNVSQADLDTSKVVADALGSGMGGYERTDEGRIVAAAFVNAYQKLVDKARYTASMKR